VTDDGAIVVEPVEVSVVGEVFVEGVAVDPLTAVCAEAAVA